MLTEIGDEIRAARLRSGTSQAAVARAARVSRSNVSRVEWARLANLPILEATLICDAVGLDLSIKTYPGRQPTRDAGHARRLNRFLGHLAPPLHHAVEVRLPASPGVPEQRAWDALIRAPDGDTGVELEQRLHDVQAQLRRVLIKWRDSGADRLLLLIADTHANRRVIDEFPEYFKPLPRLARASVLADLAAGRRPPTGWLLF